VAIIQQTVDAQATARQEAGETRKEQTVAAAAIGTANAIASIPPTKTRVPPTATPLPPPTFTPTRTPSATRTSSPTTTLTATRTSSATTTATATRTPSATITLTSTPSWTATHTPSSTATPTRTPAPCTRSYTFQGLIDRSDPTQIGYLAHNGVTSTCATVKSCPSVVSTLALHYDAYLFTNNTTVDQCVTVHLATACAGVYQIFSAAYEGSFDPNNICTNYLADAGTTGPDVTYAFTAPAGSIFVVVVHENNPNAGCLNYTLTVGGCSAAPLGTPTPTPALSAVPTTLDTAPKVGHP
jgi:hypothetical protein